MNHDTIDSTSSYQFLSHCYYDLLNKEGHAACWTCPFNLALIISLFLKRDVNKALVGEKVNRGAGYGLEIPCEY